MFYVNCRFLWCLVPVVVARQLCDACVIVPCAGKLHDLYPHMETLYMLQTLLKMSGFLFFSPYAS